MPRTSKGIKGNRMLVLSRRKGESIVIGDNIRVVIVDIIDNKIRLGIEAPKDVTIHRHEIHEKIKEQERERTETQIIPD